MMQTKVIEVRDAGTFIGMLCVNVQPDNEAQRYHMRRVGYPCDGRPNIIMTKISADGDRASNDPYYWGDRTRAVAHKWIIEHWDTLADGDVVDVEFILGETTRPKVSERKEAKWT